MFVGLIFLRHTLQRQTHCNDCLHVKGSNSQIVQVPPTDVFIDTLIRRRSPKNSVNRQILEFVVFYTNKRNVAISTPSWLLAK